MGREDLEAFKARIEKMLNEKKCADFLSELLEEAKRQTEQPYADILTTFDQVKFYWAPGQSRAFYYPIASANIANDIITEKPSGSVANQKHRREYLISKTTQSFFSRNSAPCRTRSQVQRWSFCKCLKRDSGKEKP